MQDDEGNPLGSSHALQAVTAGDLERTSHRQHARWRRAGAGKDFDAKGGERSGRCGRSLHLASSAAVAADGLGYVRPIALKRV